MTVIVNGRPAEVAAGETVAGLLAALGHPPGGPGIAVALNGEVVPRGAWATTSLGAGGGGPPPPRAPPRPARGAGRVPGRLKLWMTRSSSPARRSPRG
jgi:sulfur carrier protein